MAKKEGNQGWVNKNSDVSNDCRCELTNLFYLYLDTENTKVSLRTKVPMTQALGRVRVKKKL